MVWFRISTQPSRRRLAPEAPSVYRRSMTSHGPKPLHVNLFEMACVGHIVHGLWRHEDSNRHRYAEPRYWTELAAIAEAGCLDAIFLADVVGVYDRFADGVASSLRGAVQIPNLDPLLLVPLMAATTSGIGFGVTFSTTYEPPFAFARRMSTLDHLTAGRIGWNIVTSYLPNAARNFGHDGELPHRERYERAAEYLDVLYKLWEGSWDDGAVIRDRGRGIYADPAKVRPIDHRGAHFSVAGPHLAEPSPQRTPVLFQASASETGLAVAARHAELVFIGGQTTADVRRNIAATRQAAREAGRDPSGIKFIVMAGIVTARTGEAATRKLDGYRRLYSVEGALVHAQAEIDLRACPPDETIGAALARTGRGFGNMGRRFRPDQTVASALAQIGRFDEDRFFVCGTPVEVADAIETWLDEDGIDGINLRQYLSFETLTDFVELVVPELRRRGRFRLSYSDGETLRERFFGTGRSRLPDDHPAASYRAAAAA